MKIAVIGASGQAGSAICDALKERHDITGTSRRRRPGLVTFDPFKDDWSVLGEQDVVVNAAGQIDGSAESFLDVHLGLTRRIVANRAILGNPRIIQISALGASAKHQTNFLRTKGEADEYLLQSDNVCVVRPSIICTPQTMIVKKLMILYKLSRWTGGVLPVPSGFAAARVQPLMPGDLTDIIRLLCEVDQPPAILDVAGAEIFSFGELIQLMFAARGGRPHLIRISRKITDALVPGLLTTLAPGVINRDQYRLLFEDNTADISAAEACLGRPMRPTRDFWQNAFRNAGS